MQQQYLMSGNPILKQNTFPGLYVAKQFLLAVLTVTVILTAVRPEKLSLPFFAVMISIQHPETPFCVKAGHKLKDIAVKIHNPVKLLVFPQLIPVAQLYIRKSQVIVIPQGRQKYILVGQKIVPSVLHPPVAVAHTYQSASLIHPNMLRILVRLLKSFVHPLFLHFSWRFLHRHSFFGVHLTPILMIVRYKRGKQSAR